MTARKTSSEIPPLTIGIDAPFVPDTSYSDKFRNHLDEPYRLPEGRILLVTCGHAVYTADMRRYHLSPGRLFITPAQTIVEINEVSEDYNARLLLFKDIPTTESFERPFVISLEGEDLERIGGYFDMIAKVIQKPEWSDTTIRHLEMALLSDLRHTKYIQERSLTVNPLSHVESVFNRFLDLVSEFGSTEHRISFYADKLCLTPNRLSTLVKDFSGRTVADWINIAIEHEAKVLLRYSDLSSNEIADTLNFSAAPAFTAFFKRRTGLTPIQYRKG